MPPAKRNKRKADDVLEASDDDDDQDVNRPATAKKSGRMTQAEKAAARERARVAMMGTSAKKKKSPSSSAGTPSKRRKLSSSSDNVGAKQSPKQSPARAKKPAAAAAATTKPTSTTKKQAQQLARQRAAEWAAQKNKSRAAPAAKEEEEEEGDLPTPPASFVTTPVLPQPRFGSPSSNSLLGAAIPKLDTGVRVTAANNNNNNRKTPAAAAATPPPKEEEEEEATVEGFNTKLLIGFLVAGALAIHVLVTPLHLVFHHGVLMITGPTRYPVGVGVGASDVPTTTTRLGSNNDKINVATLISSTTTCYLDSPPDQLAVFAPGDLEDMVQYQYHHGKECPDAEHPPVICPPGHYCFRGHVVGCHTPAFELWDASAEQMVCTLRASVNATYQRLVELVEAASVQHLCLNHVDGPAVELFYTTTVEETVVETSRALTAVRNSEDNASLVVAIGAKDTPSAEKIPMYLWSSFELEDLPEELALTDEWSLETVAQANQLLQKLVVHSNGEAGTIGLAPAHYWETEATKVSTSCQMSRRLIGCLDFLGRMLLAVVMWIGTTLWYGFRVHPYLTIGSLLVVWAVHYRRVRAIHHANLLKRVNEIRLLALQELQNALSDTAKPGDGMKRGEVAVLHLRDNLAFTLHGHDDDITRQRFCYELWPLVMSRIRADNRVRKDTRFVNNCKRELWTWVATKTEDGNSSA